MTRVLEEQAAVTEQDFGVKCCLQFHTENSYMERILGTVLGRVSVSLACEWPAGPYWRVYSVSFDPTPWVF